MKEWVSAFISIMKKEFVLYLQQGIDTSGRWGTCELSAEKKAHTLQFLRQVTWIQRRPWGPWISPRGIMIRINGLSQVLLSRQTWRKTIFRGFCSIFLEVIVKCLSHTLDKVSVWNI